MDKRKIALQSIIVLLEHCLRFLSGMGVSESKREDEGLRAIRQDVEKAKIGCENEIH